MFVEIFITENMKAKIKVKKESLLEKAKKVGRKINKGQDITDEHVELALAWARGEVSYSQIKKVLGLTVPSSVYSFLAFSLRKHIAP